MLRILRVSIWGKAGCRVSFPRQQKSILLSTKRGGEGHEEEVLAAVWQHGRSVGALARKIDVTPSSGAYPLYRVRGSGDSGRKFVIGPVVTHYNLG